TLILLYPIKALGDLKAEANINLEICGEGEEEPYLVGLAKELGIDDSVQFNGFQSSINQYMAKSDLLILPSLYEGMPNVVVEALAYSVPALVSSIPAHTLLFTSGEVEFFENDNVDSLTKKLKTIFRGEIDLRKSLDHARKFVASRTVNSIATQCLAYYDGVIRGKN
ncbi:MAG: glycosyltransferase, partial [Pseudomonadales bacterium]